MDDPLISEVLERLDADATKTGATENLVLGALLGRLDDVIDGVVVERPVAATREESAPVRAYLESVAVTGFRGIGPTCKLGLRPGPGLTLVVGRNGSGKSSIAEALEFALTGDSLRWAGKSLEWKNGWRNLHAQDNPAITVGLRVDGEREPRTVRVNWSSRKLESAKTAVTVPGRGRQSLGSLGWSDAVRTFRPFLPYKELSTISEGRPIDRYNALAPMLGMETLQAPIENLRQARLSAEKQPVSGGGLEVVGMRRHYQGRGQLQHPAHPFAEEALHEFGAAVAQPSVRVVEHQYRLETLGRDDLEDLREGVCLVDKVCAGLQLGLVRDLAGHLASHPPPAESTADPASPRDHRRPGRQVCLDARRGRAEPPFGPAESVRRTARAARPSRGG